MKRSILKPPDLKESDLETQNGAELEPENELRGLHLQGAVGGNAQNARFSGVLLEGVRWSASLHRAHFENTRFRVCDLSNLDARQVFASRVEVCECRATGFRAPESDWRDARFLRSNFSLAQFRYAKFERASFQECDLREADFQNADLRGVVFHECDLRGAQFSFAKLQNADFHTSQTDGLGVEASALRGLIVSPLQAAQLSAVLGLQVRWNDAHNSANSG